MKKTKYLKSGDISEESIQKAVMQWINLNPILRASVIHIPNEGKRTSSYGKSLKDMGMRAGVSDLFIAMPRHGYNGAWIELKSKNGVLSESQRQFKYDMYRQNYFTETCYSLEETMKFIGWYCFETKSYLEAIS
jgi:VRR-NUC domain